MRTAVHRLTALTAAVLLSASGVAMAETDDSSSSSAPGQGHVLLRTTDDKGTCAAHAGFAPKAGCPTFTAYYAAPEDPQGVVVVLHGHGHNGQDFAAPQPTLGGRSQLADLAARDNLVAVAVATNELPAGIPNAKGPFDSVDEEARDAASAIAWARETFDVHRTFVLAVSMGGNGLAYLVHAATTTAAEADAAWVQALHPLPLAGIVDAEGVANLAETWAEATGFDATSEHEIEAETGGTPATAPLAYRERSLALLPSSELGHTGARMLALVHAVDDGLVPYDQTYEARAAAVAAGVPLHTYDAVFQSDCSAYNPYTLTRSLAGSVPGAQPGLDATLCMAGHADEAHPEAPVMQAAVRALHDEVTGVGPGTTVVNPTRP